MKTIFLGGTTGNDYRGRLTAMLTQHGVSLDQIFDPVVEHWDDAAQLREDEMKADSSVLMLFYLRADEAGSFLSFYSLHEATMGLYDQPLRTAVVFDYEGMVPKAARRLKKVARDLSKRFPNAPLFESLEASVTWLHLQLD